MWRLGAGPGGGWAVAGLENPAMVMSEEFRRCLDVLIQQEDEAVAKAIREAGDEFVAAESVLAREQVVEETFKDVRPPMPLLIPPVDSAEDVRDLILQVDRRWQLDARVALEDYLASQLVARELGRCWERSKPDDGLVDVSIRSVERAWTETGFDDFWLILRTDEADLHVVAEAVTDADRTAERGGTEATMSMILEPCPGGFAVLLGPTPGPQPICDWISHFVLGLQRRGVAGRIAGTAKR